jgi:outer membrane lipoprotein-sorting protein
MRMISISAALLLAVAPLAVNAENANNKAGGAKTETLSLDAIVKKHVAALGGEQLLRGGKSFTFTVTGEKMGKKFTKTVWQARPNMMRVDIQSDEGAMSKGFDGKVAWMKKGNDKAVALSADETKSMASHALFEEPLLDYAKKGTAVKLVGKTDVKGAASYDLEVTFKSGDVEHHFIDATSFLLIKRTFAGKDKDGKTVQMSVGFGDYKKIQGRMVNHSVAWDDNGKTATSVVSNVSFDKPVDAKQFAMPK